MFRLTHPLPEKVLVSVSGGMDSMCALHWLNRKPTRVLGILHINHNTGDFSARAEKFVKEEAERLGIYFASERLLSGEVPAGLSPEAYWREERYKCIDRLASSLDEGGKIPVVLAHQMNDCLEEYLICTLKRGYSGTIPYQRGICIRPFRLWKRQSIEAYAKSQGITYLEDPMNRDPRYLRAQIRYELVPKVLEINPGVWRIVEQIVLSQK